VIRSREGGGGWALRSAGLRLIIAPFRRIFGVTMGIDLGGLFVLLMSALVASAFLTAAMFGAMFALHKYGAGKVPEAGYDNFDFDNITKPTLSEFLVRLATIIFPATILLPLLTNILFPPLGAQGFRRHYAILTLMLFILETAAIGAGLWKILKIDRLRIAIFTGAGAFAYMILYWVLLYKYLYD